MTRFAFFGLALLMITVSCTTVPADLVVANTVQAQALARAQDGRVAIIDAYEKELLAAYAKQLDMIQAQEIAKVSVPYYGPSESQPTGVAVPVADVERIIALKEQNRERIAGLMAAKRAEFLIDDNLSTATKINAVSSSWLKASADGAAEFQSHVEQLLATVQVKVTK